MRKVIFINTMTLIAVVLVLTVSTFAQRRRSPPSTRTAPAVVAEKEVSTREVSSAVKRAVKVVMKDRTDVTGDYAGADQSALFVMVAGNRLTLKLDDISMVYFGEPPPTAAAVAEPQQDTMLVIEAGIIYKMGGNLPVGRTDFVLLDESLETILNGVVPPGRTGVLSEYGLALKFPSQYQGVAKRAQAAISSHTVASTSTDFSGKAQFSGLKPGNYFLSGFASTRKGFAVWNVPVEVKPGKNSVFLDQNNAAIAL